MNAFDLRARFAGFSLEAAAAWDAPATALFGASGSGKTTILETLAGLRPEVAGTALLRGRRLERLPARARRVGWVPQDASLFPHLTVRENLEFAATARGGPAASIDEAADALELGPLLDQRASALSGGERQRAALARALASRPDFLLLDEPLASIDRPLRVRVLPFLQAIPARLGIPFLLVSHDPLEVQALAAHAIVLERGRVVASGSPRSLFPAAALFGSLEALQAENVFEVAAVDARAGGLRVRTAGGAELEMAAVAGFPAPRRVAVRAEEVLLATRPPEGLSAQNVLAGVLEALEPREGQVLARVRSGGERWAARVTARAADRLGLAPGAPVYLVIKAHAILPAA